MPAAPAIFMGIAAAASVAGTAYTIAESESQKTKAQEFQAQQKKDQEKLLADAKAQQEQQQKQEEAVVQQGMNTISLRQERLRRAGGGTGRSGTLLTGPLGLSNTAPASGAAPKKTLLGA